MTMPVPGSALWDLLRTPENTVSTEMCFSCRGRLPQVDYDDLLALALLRGCSNTMINQYTQKIIGGAIPCLHPLHPATRYDPVAHAKARKRSGRK